MLTFVSRCVLFSKLKQQVGYLLLLNPQCNNSHYMTTYKLYELGTVGKDTYKYLGVKTDLEL